MTIKFVATSFGPGSFVRFKQAKSHNWQHAIYRGVSDDKRMFLFSETPLGPISRWLMYWPEIIECATTGRGLDAEVGT